MSANAAPAHSRISFTCELPMRSRTGNESNEAEDDGYLELEVSLMRKSFKKVFHVQERRGTPAMSVMPGMHGVQAPSPADRDL